ncbi:unnamed protein product [marine sediment metagenome]|uniref:Uncharacterized protein n=1 Tax=marine sediment metagenome TaxID=412755 RepID=X0SJU9_9ZZZZ
MNKSVPGLIALVAGLILLIIWFGDFTSIFKGVIPIILVIIGAIALLGSKKNTQ